MRPKFQSLDLTDKNYYYPKKKEAVQQTCKHLPWEERSSQILFSTVPKECLHASFQYRRQRWAVVLRISAQHRIIQVCCYYKMNYQIILANDPSNLVFHVLQWQAARWLEKALISHHETGWVVLYIIFSFRSKVVSTTNYCLV